MSTVRVANRVGTPDRCGIKRVVLARTMRFKYAPR